MQRLIYQAVMADHTDLRPQETQQQSLTRRWLMEGRLKDGGLLVYTERRPETAQIAGPEALSRAVL